MLSIIKPKQKSIYQANKEKLQSRFQEINIWKTFKSKIIMICILKSDVLLLAEGIS